MQQCNSSRQYAHVCNYYIQPNMHNDTLNLGLQTVSHQPITIHVNDINRYYPPCDYTIFECHYDHEPCDYSPKRHCAYCEVQEPIEIDEECEIRDSGGLYDMGIRTGNFFGKYATKAGRAVMTIAQNLNNQRINKKINAKYPQKNVLAAVRYYVTKVKEKKAKLIDNNLNTLNGVYLDEKILGIYLQELMNDAFKKINEKLEIYELCIRSKGTLDVKYGANQLQTFIQNFDQMLSESADSFKYDMKEIVQEAKAIKVFLHIENLQYRFDYNEQVNFSFWYGETITDKGTLNNRKLSKNFEQKVKVGARTLRDALEDHATDLNKQRVVVEYIKFLRGQDAMDSEIEKVKQRVLDKYPDMHYLFEEQGNTLQNQNKEKRPPPQNQNEQKRPPPQNPDAFYQQHNEDITQEQTQDPSAPPVESYSLQQQNAHGHFGQLQNPSQPYSLQQQNAHGHLGPLQNPSQPYSLQQQNAHGHLGPLQNPSQPYSLQQQNAHGHLGPLQNPSAPTVQHNPQQLGTSPQAYAWYHATNNPELYGL